MLSVNFHTLRANPYDLKIGWLYPDLMSTYGDRGNVIVLKKRCEWRNITVVIKKIFIDTPVEVFQSCDFLFMGGAQDRQQKIVAEDLRKKSGVISEMVEKGIPGLYICGAFQFLGKYYKEADDSLVEGLGIFDLYTENPGIKAKNLFEKSYCHPDRAQRAGRTKEPACWTGEEGSLANASSHMRVRFLDFARNDTFQIGSKRLIGNTVTLINPELSIQYPGESEKSKTYLVGFENHGGRTYLRGNVKPLGKIVRGFGNNGKDGTEGAFYKNSFGTYLHGPILTKNPHFADYLIKKALEVKYKKSVNLFPLDDGLEKQAHISVANRLGVRI